MITIKLPITYHSSEDADLVISIQRLQSSMIRSAYKAASFGLAEISVREELRNRFSSTQLDSWFQQSAVKSGIVMVNITHANDSSHILLNCLRKFRRHIRFRCRGEQCPTNTNYLKPPRIMRLNHIAPIILAPSRIF